MRFPTPGSATMDCKGNSSTKDIQRSKKLCALLLTLCNINMMIFQPANIPEGTQRGYNNASSGAVQFPG